MKKVPVIIGIVSIIAAVGLFFGFSNNGKQPDGPIDDKDPKYQNQLIEAPKLGNPNDYDAKSNLYISNYLYAQNSMNYSSFTVGKTTAKVTFVDYTQKISNHRIINKDEAFLEALSVSSMKSVGVQRYITPNDYLIRKGSKVTMEGANWDDKAVALSKESYLEKYGGLPFNYTSYIINDYSIVQGELLSEENGIYVYEYTLDTEIAPSRYGYEIMTMGGANGLPSFKEVSITVTMDSSWRVLKLLQYEKYSLPLFGGITCIGNLEETFTYSEEEIEVPEKDFFEEYFGSSPDDEIDEEKTAVEYLGEAFMPLISSDSPLYFNGEILTSATSKYDIKAKINISKSEFEILLDNKIYGYLIEDDAVLKYGNIVVGISKTELLDAIKDYLPKNEDGTPADITSLVSLESMGALLEDATMIKQDKNVTISLTIEDTLSVSLILLLNEQGTAKLRTIKVKMVDDDKYTLTLNLSPDIISFPEKPDNISYITNLKEIKEDIISIQEQKTAELELSFAYPIDNDTLDIFGNIIIDFNDSNRLEATGLITIVYGLNRYELSLSFIKDTFYLSYGETINVKLSIQEIQNLLEFLNSKYHLGLENNFDFNKLDITELFKSIDFTSIISAIESDENGFAFILNLLQFNLDETISLGYDVNDGFILSCDYGTISLHSSSPLSLVENGTITYVRYDNLIKYIESIDTIINSRRFDANFDIAYMANGKVLSINGFALLDLNDGLNFAIEGKISYGDIVNDIEFTLKKIDDIYYLRFAETAVRLSQEELIDFITNLDDKYNLGLKEQLQLLEGLFSSNELSSIPFETLLNGLILNDDISLSFNTNDFGISYGVIDIKIDTTHNILSISSNDLLIDISISNSLEEITSDSDIVYSTIRALEQMQTTIEEILKQKYYQGKITSKMIDGNLYIDITDINNIYLYLSGQITLNEESEEFILEYKEHNIKLAINSLGISINEKEILPIIRLLDEEFDLGIESQYDTFMTDFDSNKVSTILSNLISSLRITDDNISFSTIINDELGVMSGELKFGKEFSINISSNVFSLEISPTNKDEFNTPKIYYGNAEEIKALIKKSKVLSTQKLFTISLDISTLINNAPLEISGNLTIDITDGLDLHGDLDIIYDRVRLQLEIAKLKDKIYVHTDSLNFAFSYEELRSFIIELNTRYNFGIDTDKIPTELTIPEIDKNKLSSMKFLSLLKMVSLSENGLLLDVDIDFLGKINLSMNYDTQSSIAIINGDIGDIQIDYGSPIAFTPLNNADDYLGHKDAIKICNLIDTLINQFKIEKVENEDGTITYEEKSIHFTFNADIFNSRVNQSAPRFNASASVFIKLLSDGNLNININLDVTGESTHNIDFTYINDTIYCTYNGVNMAIEWKTLIQTLRYANDTFKFLDESTANMIFGILGTTEKLDSTIFDSIINKEDSEPFLITNLIKSLSISDDTFALTLNNNAIYPYQTAFDTKAIISINSGNLSSISISNIYTSEYEYFSPSITFDELTTDIIVPTGTYNFFNNIDSLLKEFVKTAELRNYNISGKIVMDILGFITGAEINDLEIKVSIDDNDKVKAYIHLTIPQKQLLICGNTLNIYIEDEFIYIDDYYNSNATIFSSKKHSYQKYLLSEFFNDKAAENIVNLFHFASSLHNVIINKINSPKDTTPTFEKTFKEYQSDAIGTYYLKVDGGDLASDSNIGDISLTLQSNSDGYLYRISNLKADMVTIISLVMNLELIDIGTIITVPSPDYSLYA